MPLDVHIHAEDPEYHSCFMEVGTLLSTLEVSSIWYKLSDTAAGKIPIIGYSGRDGIYVGLIINLADRSI